MRKLREAWRLHLALSRPGREIARSCGLSPSSWAPGAGLRGRASGRTLLSKILGFHWNSEDIEMVMPLVGRANYSISNPKSMDRVLVPQADAQVHSRSPGPVVNNCGKTRQE